MHKIEKSCHFVHDWILILISNHNGVGAVSKIVEYFTKSRRGPDSLLIIRHHPIGIHPVGCTVAPIQAALNEPSRIRAPS